MGNSILKNWFSENNRPTKPTPIHPSAEDVETETRELDSRQKAGALEGLGASTEELKTEIRERESRQKAERLSRIKRRNQLREKSRQKLELERQKEQAILKEKT